MCLHEVKHNRRGLKCQIHHLVAAVIPNGSILADLSFCVLCLTTYSIHSHVSALLSCLPPALFICSVHVLYLCLCVWLGQLKCHFLLSAPNLQSRCRVPGHPWTPYFSDGQRLNDSRCLGKCSLVPLHSFVHSLKTNPEKMD